ncbi:amino acid adenylation domain-containing protein [Tolypothrix tenuis PCC 7101]|uniref:Amino acid adenylation domain-containing protein n=1 Tax=Tolypothrix tenuis PCC 7101 TaxID=231146 RepID=A0A1Z4N1U4_9CYAN|nr:non-ribosomal peptide synthetase [Aulosira sp. FACHB-113]BAY99674.1 amino acid adenylation domain-containing protein [Tolypothrix tenuis PCC 7101]BAZ76404.1 amino acid adenylation domain-containing protein [Aulosira laxa NIES-50]
MTLSPVNFQSGLTAVEFDPFAEGELLLTAPATESQKEIWASVQMGDAANCAYNESQSLRLKGELDVKVFQSALQELVLRHEALRTTFSTDGNTLCIVDSLQIEIPIIDISSLEKQEQQEKLASIRQQEVEKPFDLEHGPLFRAQIIKLQPQEHIAILTAHHIICDGWSWAVLIPDLGKLYSGLLEGIVPELDESDRLSDYAVLQEEEVGSPEALATEQYWLEQFADSVPVLDFPCDRPRPHIRTFNAAREDWQLNPELVADLKQLGTKFGCSFMTTILAGFEAWLHRITGQNDLVVGIPAAGQAALGQYNLVGHCVNLLPLRSQVNGAQSFSEYLQSRRSTVLDAYDHQQFTFGSLVKKLSIPRDSSRIPLVPITFNIDQGLDSDKLPFAGLEVEFFSNPRSFENFEIFINATELRGQLTLECQYNTNLFDADTIRRRMAEFETLLQGIVVNPNQTIAKLPILPAVEQQLLATWNQTQTNYPQDKSIHQLFEEQVARTPDAVALVFPGQQLTYQELNTRANQLAQYLQTLGVGADVLVGICVERSLEMIVGLLGILKAGGAYVPLDPGYPQERLAFMLADTQIKLLVTQKRLVEKLPTHTANIICLDADWQTISQQATENLITNVKPYNLAYVMYTSGSTGTPKGVSVIHQGVVRLVKETNYVSLTDKEVFLQISPVSFDASTFEIWGCLLNGGKLVIFPPHTPSLDELGGIIQQYQVTTLWLTAGLFHLIVDEKIEALKPLRQLLAGGDVLSVPHVQKFLNTVENCKLINGYGPTESTTFTSCYEITAPLKPGASIPIGRPIANTQVYILDSHLQQVPIGITGELYIGGDGLAREYFNRPDLTAERFIANPLSADSQSRLYKSGDLARYLPNGEIEYLGRIDNQVKVSGFRIELGEIEIALLQSPLVKEAVVIVREDSPGEKLLVGYFVAETNEDSSQIISELRRFLKQQLPEYMVPKIFVALEALPLNANGKVDRRALPKPDAYSPELEANYVAPRTPIEQQIADIWTQVLNVKQVGIYDNFFELGGYSLLGIQVISRLRQALQVEILMSNLFELPTVADLAERVETLRWATQGIQAAESHSADDYEEGEL